MNPGAQLLLALLALHAFGQAQTPDFRLIPRMDGDSLGVRLPSLNILTGKPLERLKNGQSVAFDFHLQWLEGATGTKIVSRSAERFVVSYDLWEENFSIVQLASANSKSAASRISRLKSDAVTTWCLGRLRLPLFQIDRSRPTRLLLEIRSAGPKLPNPIRGEGSIDLGALIDIFSRPANSQDVRFTASSASFTLLSLASP